MSESVFLIPWATVFAALIGLRLVAWRNGEKLPFFYFASKRSKQLDPGRLQRYRALRVRGFGLGISIVALGYAWAIAADAPSASTAIFYTVGIFVALSSGFYLEYCIATGKISPPSET